MSELDSSNEHVKTGGADENEGRSLNRKMAKGASWLILFRLTDRGIGFVSTLILARLLVPADFGLVAIAMSILTFVAMLSAFSFDVALIQNAKAERRHYDTAWTFNVIFGCANGLALLVLALPVAAFYKEPRIVGIMIALAANCTILEFGNIGIVAFQKNLDLHKEFILGLTKKLAAFTVTVSLAFMFRSYWALLAGTLVSTIVAVAASYWMHPYRPRFSLQGRKELFQFSKWMLLNNLLISLAHRLPDLIIGKLAGPMSLGLYTVAYEISNLPTTELVFPISRAVFPGYAKMANDGNALQHGFLNVLSVILLITVPAGLGIIVLAEPFVHVLLGAKWVTAIPLIQVLGIYGILRASSSNTGAVYLALGLPRLLTYLTLFGLVILIPGLWWFVREYGVIGAGYAVVLSALIQVPLGFAIVTRQLKLKVAALFGVMWRPVFAGLLMATVIVAIRNNLGAGTLAQALGYPLQLLVLIPLGAVAYASAIFGLWFIAGRPHGGESKVMEFLSLTVKKRMQSTTRSPTNLGSRDF